MLDLLETLRVANIEPEETSSTAGKSDAYDPFADDPVRNPMLKVHTRKPFNAETPSQLLGKDFLTPNEAFFVRNHLPVPVLNESDYRLELTGLGLDRTYEFTLDDLKQLPQHDVICSIQCAGNRRKEFNEFGEVKGSIPPAVMFNHSMPTFRSKLTIDCNRYIFVFFINRLAVAERGDLERQMDWRLPGRSSQKC